MPIPSYPLDLTAVLPSNHITGEVHVITTPRSRFFVPVGGPFFTQSMILRNNVTNALLMPNNDFKILHHHAEGSAATGKNVCAIIYITNPLIASVNLEYQCVGGVYSDTSDIIRQMIVDHPLDPDQPQLIGWEQVFGQPSQYPISAHQHLANQFWGYGDLVASIEQLRVAVASGDNAAMAAIYRYIELMINNNNYLTADDLNGLLQTPDTFIKTHPTYNALRNRVDFSDNLPVVYMTIGKVITFDGLGMMFRWEPASMVDDDDHHVIRPTNRLVTEPGRLVSMLWAENMLRPVLDTLGRRILPNGTIETRISVTNHANGANLGTLITPGLYWIDNACGGRPNNVDNGMLYVERSDANYIFQRVHGGQNAPVVQDNTENRTDYTEHVRIGIRSNVNDPLVWSEWESMLTKRRAMVNGLDTHLAETNIAGADLNTHVRTGVMWVGDTNLNRAFDRGILRVTVLNATDVIQEMYNANNRAVRYGYNGVAYENHSWLPWVYSQQAVLIETSDFNATAQSLDACAKVGRHWFGLQNANRPFDQGMVEVVQLTSMELMQIAYSTLDQGTATRTWKAGLGWTTWAQSATTAELQAATALPSPYYWASLSPGVYGGMQYVTHYCPAGARRLSVAIVAPGGGGGAGGFGSGGSGGGGGAGSFGQLVVVGDLTGCYLVVAQPPINESGWYAPSGYNSAGHAPNNNPASLATLYDAYGTAIMQMTCGAGWTGGGGDTERGGDDYSWPGSAGANGSASMWRNSGYSAKILVHSFMTNGGGANASNGIGNAGGPGGSGGTVDTSARDGYGGNLYGDGNGGQGGNAGVSGPAVNTPGNGAVGHTGVAVVRIE